MPRILIAESNQLVACGLQATLRSHGFKEVVGQARTEAEMFELIEGFAPDLVILDFVIPSSQSSISSCPPAVEPLFWYARCMYKSCLGGPCSVPLLQGSHAVQTRRVAGA